MKQLTAKQEDVMAVIEAFMVVHGHTPTVREIAEAIGSKFIHGANYYIGVLASKGAIIRLPFTARGIELRGFVPLAFLGEVKA